MTTFVALQNINDEALQGYDAMMIEAGLKVPLSALADNIWSEVLRELDLRGKVTLINGSYDDPSRARVKRNY